MSKITKVEKKNSARLPDEEPWELRLYVAGQTAKSVTAFANLKKICEEHIPGKYSIEVVDLLKNPKLAKGDQILAIPTLVRKLPQPIRKILGDLSDTERVLESHRAELERCRKVTSEQVAELRECRLIWAENRRRFLGSKTPAVSCIRADTSPSWCRLSPKVISNWVSFLK